MPEDDVMAMIRTGLPTGVGIAFDADVQAQFRDAEFYPGAVAVVTGPRGSVYVERSGDSRLRSPEDDIRTAAQFRELFPDGNTPEDGAPFAAHVTTTVDPGQCQWTWANNAWFTLVFYNSISADSTICENVFDAINQAIAMVAKTATEHAPQPAPSTMVTLWTLTMNDSYGGQSTSSVHYTEAETTEYLRDNYAEDEDVTDENLEAFLVRQGLSWTVDTLQMDTARMSNPFPG